LPDEGRRRMKTDLGATIEVAVALPVFGTYTYRLPDGLRPRATVGLRVLVPFGNRRVTGYILGRATETRPVQIKTVLDLLDRASLFPEGMIPFFRWIADYYLHPLGEVIRGALPSGLNLYEYNLLAVNPQTCPLPEDGQLSALERDILACLHKGACRLKDLQNHLDRPIPGALLHAMIDCGWVVRRKTLRGGRTRPKKALLVRRVASLPADVRITPKRKAVLSLLADQVERPLKTIRAQIPGAAAIVQNMARRGLVEIIETTVYRDPFGDPILPDQPPALTAEQAAALETIAASRREGFTAFLLDGVTGSGKTEIYLQAAAETMHDGRSVLILVPEIALISQTERRFRARFGDCVAVLHSGLSAGERLDQWLRIRSGKAPIVIGARSAIFAPLDRIGLIVVDEEHDGAYKQETGLRYSARDLATVRARMSACPVILGSATPSVQSYFNHQRGKFTRIRLSRRVHDKALPQVKVLDLRTIQHERGVRKYLTTELLEAIAATLARREQTLVFLNRRGYANYPICSECGETLKCRHCSITLTYHQRANAYRCHYCGFSRSAAATCPQCGSDKIWHYGLGTEKLEAYLEKYFPDARVARLDRDTTRRKNGLLGILKKLRKGEIDILIGTQMVAKGHDYPNITLVGVVCADNTLNFPDFRAGERTFQLLAQVAGRAGRGEQPGRVILQTYTPEHFIITAARRQNFARFYADEIKFRRELVYPPFCRMVQLLISGRDQGRTARTARALGRAARARLDGSPSHPGHLNIMGPVEAAMHRVAGHYRWQMLIRGARAADLNRFVGELLYGEGPGYNRGGVKVIVDVDPLFMM
jgi:primosomal protein N' (replication factor Y)